MRSTIKNLFLICLVAFFTSEVTSLLSQETTTEDKKIIITEETTDADGNTVTRKITIEGDISPEDLKDLLDDESDPSNQIIIGGERPNLFRKDRIGRNNLRNRNYFHIDRDAPNILRLRNSPTLGIYLNTEDGQLVVSNVLDDSAAEEAGMKKGDILVSIEGNDIASVKDIQNVLKNKEEGDEVKLLVIRENDKEELSVKVRSHEFHGIISEQPRWNRPRNKLRSSPFGLMQRPKLGILIQDNENGVLIEEVTEDSAAEKAGLKEGDFITGFNGTEIRDTDHLIELVKDVEGDQTVEIEFERDGQKQTTQAELSGKKKRKRL